VTNGSKTLKLIPFGTGGGALALLILSLILLVTLFLLLTMNFKVSISTKLIPMYILAPYAISPTTTAPANMKVIDVLLSNRNMEKKCSR